MWTNSTTCKCTACFRSTNLCVTWPPAFRKVISKLRPVGTNPTHDVSLSLKLSGDAVHGDRSGEADEAAEAVARKNSVFGLSDAQRP